MTDKDDSVESGAIGVADVFKDDEPEAVTQEVTAAEPESKGEEEEPEAEVEATAEPEATEEPTAEPPSAEPVSVPRQALLDERRKRQALEEEVTTLRKQVAPKDEQAPDPLDDPEGYKNYLRSQWENERITEVTNKSRERMLETTPDYEEMEKHFTTLAMADPSLVQKLKTHHDPAKFAYDTARESKDKTFAEYEKKVIEKLKKEGKLKEKPSAPEVATLINSPGAGKNNNHVVKPIDSLGEIFAGKP